MNSFIRRGLLAIAAALMLTATVAVPASASVPTDDAQAAGQHAPTALLSDRLVPTGYNIPEDTNPPSEAEQNDSTAKSIVNTPSRTLNRWGDAANGFHSKYDGFIGTQLVDMSQRSVVQGGAMVVGNWAYKASSEMTQFSVRLDVIDGMGATLDGIVKVMLEAIINVTGAAGSGLLFGILAILAVLFALWRSMRGGPVRMIRQVGGVVLIIAIVFGVGSAALKHNPGSDDGYNPSPMSPGWFVKGVNNTLSGITSEPAAAFVKNVEGPIWGRSLEKNQYGGVLGCGAYTEAMDAQLTAISPRTSAGRSMVSIASVMDAMWDSTGLSTWAYTQGGYNNHLAAKVYCRILDMRSGNGGGQAAYTTYIATANYLNWKNTEALSKAIRSDASTRAPFAPSNAENTAASIVAWAACRPTSFTDGRFTWAWDRQMVNYQGGHEIFPGNPRGWKLGDLNANDECQKWWTASAEVNEDGTSAGNQDIPKVFYIKGDLGWIHDRTKDSPASVRDFLISITGVNPMGGTTGVVSYAFGAVLSLIAFGLIAIIVIVAKLFAAAFIIALWFVLIGSIFRPAEMKDRLGKTLNKFIGTAIFAALTSVVLAFVVVFTRALIRIGLQLWGTGTVGSMLWSGLSPIIAILITHIVFTKVFRLPSPVSIRGAQAWAKAGASGAIGTGVAAGAGSFAGTMLGNMARGALRKAGDGVLHKATGGRLGAPISRRGMSPVAAGKGALDAVADAAAAEGAPAAGARKGGKGRGETGATALSAAEQLRADVAADSSALSDQKRTDRADLKAARQDFRATTGEAAPGDFLGAAAVAASRLGTKVRDAAHGLVQRTGLPAVASEVSAHRDARRAAVAARKASVAERAQARAATRDAAGSVVRSSASSIDSVMNSAESVAKRARWGLAGAASTAGLGLNAAAAATGPALAAAVSTAGPGAAESALVSAGAGIAAVGVKSVGSAAAPGAPNIDAAASVGGARVPSASEIALPADLPGAGAARSLPTAPADTTAAPEIGDAARREVADAAAADAVVAPVVDTVVRPQVAVTPVVDQVDVAVAAPRVTEEVAGPSVAAGVAAGAVAGAVTAMGGPTVRVGETEVQVAAPQVRSARRAVPAPGSARALPGRAEVPASTRRAPIERPLPGVGKASDGATSGIPAKGVAAPSLPADRPLPATPARQLPAAQGPAPAAPSAAATSPAAGPRPADVTVGRGDAVRSLPVPQRAAPASAQSAEVAPPAGSARAVPGVARKLPTVATGDVQQRRSLPGQQPAPREATRPLPTHGAPSARREASTAPVSPREVSTAARPLPQPAPASASGVQAPRKVARSAAPARPGKVERAAAPHAVAEVGGRPAAAAARPVKVAPAPDARVSDQERATTAVARAAAVISAPATAAHAVRSRVWKAQDASQAGAQQVAERIVNSPKVVAAQADAAIVRAAVRAGGASLRGSDLYQDSAKAVERTNAVISRGLRRFGAGVAAVAHRGENNKALIEAFRTSRAEAAATEPEAPAEQGPRRAAHMMGEGSVSIDPKEGQ